MNRVMLWRARFGDSIALEGGPRPDPRYQRTVASAMIFALTIGAAFGATAQKFGAGRSQRHAGVLAKSGPADPDRGGFA